ncbi:very short patch repair endonuclease [Leptospira kirschneri]|uniref:very short patch repair endonuclease n=1 Tax=Leptospira kirschneri TaxID=29507 RepID=UPI00037DE9A9|nr:very short patch repair endonuclease [Leptospira kirschneri]UML81101.1 very short patch repair endonuclease [Leptospira kirschneri]
MTDVFSKNKRSQIMRQVKSKNNKSTELKLIKILRRLKISGWRRNVPLQGKPDFVFPRLKIVVFTDGCFWHGHNCRNVKPKENAIFWNDKVKKTIKRDKLTNQILRKKGYSVLRFWECKISEAYVLKRFSKFLLIKE